jgi:hypothetical protein
MIKTIDAFAHEAIQINSRGSSASFNLSEFRNCEILKGITIDFNTLQEFYESPSSTILALKHEELLANLDLFITHEMDDRNYQKIAHAIKSNYLSATIIRNYLLENGLFESTLFKAYRAEADEFNFLKNSKSEPILRKVLQEYSPNIIYLDSGEYSSNIEFNMIDELAEKGTILIMQDIFFPKSIKSFLIASAIIATNKWRVLWVDRTTPQGVIICKKEYSSELYKLHCHLERSERSL